MSEGQEYKIRGEILVSPPMVVEWKVPNFFSSSKELEYLFRSPSFSYLDKTWFIDCYPNGQKCTRFGWMDLYLVGEGSSSTHTITYQLGIRREDGVEYISATETRKFAKVGWGVKGLVERASLLRNKRLVAPGDEITIFCILRDGLIKSSTSQTARSEGIHELSQSLKDVFISGEHHDTIIKVKGEEFRTHKFILVVRSSVFASMFRHDTIECRTGVITVDDCDPNAFREFLSYMYSGKLENVSTGNVLDLYFIADKYEVEGVKAECVKFMISNFSVDSFCDYMSLALMHDEMKLLNSAIDYFIKNVKTIIVTKKWESLLEEYPLMSNELYIKAIMNRVPD